MALKQSCPWPRKTGSIPGQPPMHVSDPSPTVPGVSNAAGSGATPQDSNISVNGATPRGTNASGNSAMPQTSNASDVGATALGTKVGSNGATPQGSNVGGSVALINLGNEVYAQGKFGETLAFYDQAMTQESSNPMLAALMGLGRLNDSVDECHEALKLDPSSREIHQGNADKALWEYLQCGSYAKKNEIARAQTIQKHLNNCIQARNSGNWQNLLRETRIAILAGAMSAPLIYALRAEALLNLNKHQKAISACQKVLVFPIEFYVENFGRVVTAYLCTVTAHVYYSVGRSEDAIATARQAAELDQTNLVVPVLIDKVKEVSVLKWDGDVQYNASKFSEACIIYSSALELNPYNLVLQCNRAACWSSLGQFETALKDLNTALKVDPSNSEARRQRAACYAKVKRWEAAIADYKMLVKEFPDVATALLKVKVQLKKSRGEDTTNMAFGSNLVSINNLVQFTKCISSPGALS
ncbi:hypothetical protein ACFE04_026003 [Oxalis oulophora]